MTKFNVTATSDRSGTGCNSFSHCVRYALSLCIVLLAASSALADEPWRQLRSGEFFFYTSDGQHSNINELSQRMKGKKARIVDCRTNQPMTFAIHECGQPVAKTTSCGDVVGMSLRESLYNSTKTPGTNHLTLSCKQGEYSIHAISPVGKKTWNPTPPKVGVIVVIE